MFPTLNEFLEHNEDVWLGDGMKSQITNHLQSLRDKFTKYFPRTVWKELAFVRNSYLLVQDENITKMFKNDDSAREEFILLTNNSTMKDIFKETLYQNFG